MTILIKFYKGIFVTSGIELHGVDRRVAAGDIRRNGGCQIHYIRGLLRREIIENHHFSTVKYS